MKYYVIDVEYSQTDKSTIVVYAGSKEKAFQYIKDVLNMNARYYTVIRESNVPMDVWRPD